MYYLKGGEGGMGLSDLCQQISEHVWGLGRGCSRICAGIFQANVVVFTVDLDGRGD